MVVPLSEGLDGIEAQESLRCKPDHDLEHDPVSDLRRHPFVLFVVDRNSDVVGSSSVHGHLYTRVLQCIVVPGAWPVVRRCVVPSAGKVAPEHAVGRNATGIRRRNDDGVSGVGLQDPE